MKYLQILANSTGPSEKDWGYTPYIFITIGNIIWPLAWIYSNEHNINYAEASCIRGIALIPFNYLVCRWFSSPTDFKNQTSYKVLFLRSMLMVVHSFLFSLSQFILPLPIVHTINCSGTLFVFLVDYLLNHVKINIKQVIGIAFGILGAILATNGALITKYFYPQYHYETRFQNYITEDPVIRAIFSIFFIFAILAWAFGVVITKRAQANTFQINYILGLCLLFSGAIAYPYVQSKCSPYNLFIGIITLGLPLILGQWFYIGALTMTKNTGVLNMLNFTAIFIGYLISIFKYHEHPNIVTILGVLLVFFGVWKVVFNKQTQK